MRSSLVVYCSSCYLGDAEMGEYSIIVSSCTKAEPTESVDEGNVVEMFDAGACNGKTVV